jgi:steroid delta-isomerase-like uncharacterized protein
VSADPVAVVRALLDAFEAGDLDAARELVADDFAVTTHVGAQTVGREAWLDAHAQLDAAFPDLHRDVLDLRADGADEVRVEMAIEATNDRPIHLPGVGVDLPHPTGRRLRTVPNVDHFRVRDGRVTTYRSDQPPGAGLRGLLDQISAGGPQP